MGANDNRPPNTERAAETGTDNTSSASTAKRGRGRPPGSTNKKQSQELPRLVAVEVPTDPKEEKKEEEKPKAPARKRTPRKPAKKKADTTQLKMLVLTISGLVASRPGMEVWNMTPEEVDQIIEPLGNIMAKHDVGAAASEYADYIALVMAAFVIFIPKYLMWKATRPKKEKRKLNVKRPASTTDNEGRKIADSSTGDASGNAINGTDFGGQLHDLMPAVGGI